MNSQLIDIEPQATPVNLSRRELALRRKAYDYAKASVELEGFKVSDEVEALFIAERDGLISSEELLAKLDERNRAHLVNGKRK